ncbi:MAG TPA: hypothetical protein VGA56_03170 [Opitutaceae bacterium]|jgi:hypothetical protein
MKITSQNQTLGILVTRRSRAISSAGSAMDVLRRFLFVLGLAYTASPSVAAPQIDINFEADQASGNEWIRAQTNYHTN